MLTHEDKAKVRVMLGLEKDAPIPEDVTAFFDQATVLFRNCNIAGRNAREALPILFMLGKLTGQFAKAKAAKAKVA